LRRGNPTGAAVGLPIQLSGEGRLQSDLQTKKDREHTYKRGAARGILQETGSNIGEDLAFYDALEKAIAAFRKVED